MLDYKDIITKHYRLGMTGRAIANSSMAELGKYYGVEVAPCSPYTPKGKPGVEGGVKNAYQRIYNALRNCVFYSIDDLNEAITVELEAYNCKSRKN